MKRGDTVIWNKVERQGGQKVRRACMAKVVYVSRDLRWVRITPVHGPITAKVRTDALEVIG